MIVIKIKKDRKFGNWNVSIDKTNWITSFCEKDKRKIWKRIREETKL